MRMSVSIENKSSLFVLWAIKREKERERKDRREKKQQKNQTEIERNHDVYKLQILIITICFIHSH